MDDSLHVGVDPVHEVAGLGIDSGVARLGTSVAPAHYAIKTESAHEGAARVSLTGVISIPDPMSHVVSSPGRSPCHQRQDQQQMAALSPAGPDFSPVVAAAVTAMYFEGPASISSWRWKWIIWRT